MGEQSCIQAYKNCFQWINIILAFIAAVLGMAACASFSNKPGIQMNVPFVIQPLYTWTGTDDAVLQGKGYYGLSGYTFWISGGYLQQLGMPPQGNIKATYNYADTYDALKCGTDDYLGYKSPSSNIANPEFMDLGCDALNTCATVGKVSMAFTCLGFLCALVTMILSYKRKSMDSWAKKIMSMLFSFVSMLCSLIAFLAFGGCMSYVPQEYTPQQDPKPPTSCSTCGLGGKAYVLYPGPGGGLSLASVVFFHRCLRTQCCYSCN